MENRTLRVGMVSLFAFISVPIGAALSGILFREFKFYGVYIISTVLYLLSFIYGVIVIRDVKPTVEENSFRDEIKTEKNGKKSSWCAITNFFDLKHVKNAFQVALKRENENRRLDILLLLIIMVIIMGPLSG